MFVEQSLKASTDHHGDDSRKLSGVSKPHENDILMGRGGKNNQHSGNEKLREFAREKCEEYCLASKKGKSEISRELVRLMRELTPPARFLKRNPVTTRWEDVGDDIAREKTSQVLRDAVAEKHGPVTKSKTSYDQEEEDEKICTNISFSQKGTTSLQTMVECRSQERAHTFASTAQREEQSGEPRSDVAFHIQLKKPDHSSTLLLGSTNALSSVMFKDAPLNPHVTPVTTSAARKRPRYYESPVPSAFDHTSRNSTMMMATTNTPPGMILTPPLPNSCQLLGQNSPYFYSSSPSSAGRSFPYQQCGYNNNQYSPQLTLGHQHQPWVADVPPYAAPPPPPAPAITNSEFDLLNGELLSDSERDGAISPFLYPKRDSL